MNFMFHTTLDTVGNILRVHYKSTKCDVLFSQGSVSALFMCERLPFWSRGSHYSNFLTENDIENASFFDASIFDPIFQ